MKRTVLVALVIISSVASAVIAEEVPVKDASKNDAKSLESPPKKEWQPETEGLTWSPLTFTVLDFRISRGRNGYRFPPSCTKTAGLDICFMGEKTTVCGLQANLAYGRVDRLYGGQIGVGNFSKHGYGFQVGLINVGDSVYGLQVGLLNITKHGKMIQMGICNVAGFGSGKLQFGVYNYSKSYFKSGSRTCFQVGFLNSADGSKCFQIGVLNFRNDSMSPLIGWSF